MHRRLAGWALGSVGVAITLALLAVSFVDHGIRGWDAVTYLAAGERLNAGHQLYSLVPGDRWVWVNPPLWTVPLLSPPPIAVLWRPLAALPNEWGLGVWWLACAGAVGAVMFGLLRRLPLATGTAAILLAPSLAWELAVANVNGLLLAGTVGVWLLARSRHNAYAGALIGLMAAVKLWPIVLLAFFVAQGRGRAIGGSLISIALVGTVSLAGAGLAAHVRYLGVAYTTPPSMFSLAGMVGTLGIDVPWITYAVLIFGLAEIWALRSRPALAFPVAVGTMILASPVVNLNTYVLLLACLAPFAWPLAERRRVLPEVVLPAEVVPVMDPLAIPSETPPLIPA
jgi:glycosyl transferase family 87